MLLSQDFFVMNRLKMIGYALAASSFFFLWIHVLAALVTMHSLIGHGTGVEFASESGVWTLLGPLPAGAALLGAGVYLIKKGRSLRP